MLKGCIQPKTASGFAWRGRCRPVIRRRPMGRLQFSTTGKSAAAGYDPELHDISLRGYKAPRFLPQYLSDVGEITPYDPQHNPDGHISLSVAENKMNEDMLLPKYEEAFQGFPADLIYYQATAGRPEMREALADFLTEHVNHGAYQYPADNLIVGAGCNAMIDNLFTCITEPGDAVLIPRPYYAAFEFDIQCKAAATVVGVETVAGREGIGSPERYYPNAENLEQARMQALSEGLNPKVLVLCQPNNPLAVCFPKEIVKEVWEWAEAVGMHIVSDDLYGAGVFDPDSDFYSVARVAAEEKKTLGNKVHVVYSISKDFCSSGLRCGALYSENEEVLRSMKKLNDLCQMSSHTQYALTKVLSDKDWVKSYLEESNRRLFERYCLTRDIFEEYGCKVLPAEAGLFCWIDMRALLPNNTWEGEMELYKDIQNEAKLLLTPGFSMRTEEPGFFRCCFATSQQAFHEAMKRFKSFAKQRQHIPQR